MCSEMTTPLILMEVGHVYLYVKNIFTCKKYENIEITDGEVSKGIEDVWVSILASKFKFIIVRAVSKHKPRLHCIPGENVTNL